MNVRTGLEARRDVGGRGGQRPERPGPVTDETVERVRGGRGTCSAKPVIRFVVRSQVGRHARGVVVVIDVVGQRLRCCRRRQRQEQDPGYSRCTTLKPPEHQASTLPDDRDEVKQACAGYWFSRTGYFDSLRCSERRWMPSNRAACEMARVRLGTTREDGVRETSAGLFVQNEVAWSPTFRSIAGLRADGYRFDLDADNPLNSGREHAGIVSPKGGAIVGPFRGTEFYVNAGRGFHSNDARGATMTVDPATGEPVERVTPLTRATGVEGGLRTVAARGLQTTLTVWSLNLDSELVFVGDAGTTDAGRPSHRHGIELANYYRPRSWLNFDLDLSWSHGHFTNEDPAGDAIPGAAGTVVSAGMTVDDVSSAFGSVRMRYFGARPLVEDESVRSEATALVNLQAGYKISPRITLALDIFNLLDAESSDIDYFYRSRLPGEPASGIEDLHFHPTVPFTARLGVHLDF